MKTLTKITFLAAMLALLNIQTAKSQIDSTKTVAPVSSKYSYIDNTFTNKNMFFGINYGNMPLDQLFFETGNDKSSIAAWSNYSINDAHLLEVDLVATMKKELKFKKKYSLMLQPGAGYYTFPNSETPDYKEIFLKTSFTGLPADVNLRAGKLFGEGFSNTDLTDGATLDLDIYKNFKLSNKLSVAGNLELVYNSNFFCKSKELSHTSATASITYSPLENLSMTGSIIGQKRLAEHIDGVNTEAYLKLGITYNFK